jgi:hypothetical protein
LSDGNYVVGSPRWNANRGAATWGDGNTRISGIVSAANSLVGSTPGDYVGASFNPGAALTGGVTPLRNGNYLVPSPNWNSQRGAVTWGNGSTGLSGTVSDANSLVGSNPNDKVGFGSSAFGGDGIALLSNGSYVVRSGYWNGQRGAVTWGNGSTGTSGTVSEANSLVGSHAGDRAGYITALSNGNYVVGTPQWNSERGAVTWGNGTTGVSGTISDANSLVGSDPMEFVGNYFQIIPLSDSNYVVLTPNWNDHRGAVTWVSGTSGQTLDGSGMITPQNSLVGTVANSRLQMVENLGDQTFLAAFGTESRLTVGLTNPSQLTYSAGQSQSVTIAPDFLTRTLNTGTAVVLQASNDITVNSPIVVNAGGNGGALTLQAGRSIVLNAPITTDNDALTLIANDQLANGVVDSERDSGNAVIAMTPGTALNTGSGPLTVQLRDGAGLTNHDSGTITLQTVMAGSISVVNNGPSAGSDMFLGPVTTTGPQTYANPNGTATVTGNLTTADTAVTFNDSVVLNQGLTLSAGSTTVNFGGGTVSPSPGLVTVASGVALTASTTFIATLTGTDPGSYSQLSASGPVNLGGSALSLVLGFEPPVGSSFEIVTNKGAGPIMSTFAGLAEGSVFTQGTYQFLITYQGGTGGTSVVVTRLV